VGVRRSQPKVDIAFLTARPVELESVLALSGGLPWKKTTEEDYLHHLGTIPVSGKRSFSAVATFAAEMAGENATLAVSRLKVFDPVFVCMTGICAGWRKKDVQLGDVIVATKAFEPLTMGKRLLSGQFRGDLETAKSPSWLVQWLLGYRENAWTKTIATPRPVALGDLIASVLEDAASGKLKHGYVNRIATNDADLAFVLKVLQEKGSLSADFELTEEGRARYEALRAQRLELQFVERTEPVVHPGAFATVPYVVEEEGFFQKYEDSVRTIRAAEMEVAAFLRACEQKGLWGFAAKGVSDFGEPPKDDRFQAYAAEASARYVHGFLSEFEELLREQILLYRARARARVPRSRRAPPPAGGADGALRQYYNPKCKFALDETLRNERWVAAFLSVSEQDPRSRYHLGHYYMVRVLDTIFRKPHPRVALFICDSSQVTSLEVNSLSGQRIVAQRNVWEQCFGDSVLITTIGQTVTPLELTGGYREAMLWLVDSAPAAAHFSPTAKNELEQWRFKRKPLSAGVREELKKILDVERPHPDGLAAVSYILLRRPRWYSPDWFCKLMRALGESQIRTLLGGERFSIIEADKNRTAWEAMAFVASRYALPRPPLRIYTKSIPSLTGIGAMRSAVPEGVIRLRLDWERALPAGDHTSLYQKIARLFGISADGDSEAIDTLVRQGMQRLGQKE